MKKKIVILCVVILIIFSVTNRSQIKKWVYYPFTYHYGSKVFDITELVQKDYLLLKEKYEKIPNDDFESLKDWYRKFLFVYNWTTGYYEIIDEFKEIAENRVKKGILKKLTIDNINEEDIKRNFRDAIKSGIQLRGGIEEYISFRKKGVKNFINVSKIFAKTAGTED